MGTTCHGIEAMLSAHYAYIEIVGTKVCDAIVVLEPVIVGVKVWVRIDVVVTARRWPMVVVLVVVTAGCRQLQMEETAARPFLRRKVAHWASTEFARTTRPPETFTIGCSGSPSTVARLFLEGGRVIVAVSIVVI